MLKTHTALNAKRQRRKGFTLVEILLVLGILVILGGVVGVSVLQMQRTAYERAAKTQLKAFEQALDMYLLDIGQVPSQAAGLEALVNPPDDLPNPAKWKRPYFTKAIPLDPWDSPYNYEVISNESYRIYSSGPDRVPQTEDDITLD
jgi:general secretion pathway protein G